MKLTFYNEIIQFDYELGTLMKSSEDPMFTSYLNDIKNDIQKNPGRVPEYRQQVINNYVVYADKMNNLGCPVERMFFKAVYGEMEAPEIKNPVFEKPVSAAQPESSAQPSPAACPEVSAQPEAPAHVAPVQSEPIAPAQSVETAQPAPETPVQQPAPVQPASQPAAFDPYTGKPLTQNAAFDPYTGKPLTQPVKAASSETAKKTEFAVGAIVMSIIGSVFLLTGLVYFSINFLDTFAQGMVMYLVCAIVLCVSEFVIRRVVPKLSAVFTAIGISGVFLSTVVNYKSLENLNLVATAIILGICAVLVCFFGFIRKSQLYSIIGFLAAFISSIAIGSDGTPVEFLVITMCTLIISSLWLLFPVEKYYSALTPIMLFAGVIYIFFGLMYSIDSGSDAVRNFVKQFFIICCMTEINFVFFINAKRCRKYGIKNDVVNVFNIILFSIAVLICALASDLTSGKFPDLSRMGLLIFEVIIYLIFVVSEAVFTFLLKDRKDHDFLVMYICTHAMGLLIIPGISNFVVQVILLVAHCLISRYMTRYECINRGFKITDLVFQSIISAFAIGIAADTGTLDPLPKYIGLVILLAGLIASIFIGMGYLNVIQILSILAVTVIIDRRLMPSGLGKPAAVGVLLLFTFLINNIRRIKGKNSNVFNWFALIWSLTFLIASSRKDYSAEEILLFSISAIFGLALVILLMNKEYRMPFRGKYIIIPAYLTFISFLIPLEKGFVLSIILMAIAVISVVIGFVLKEKSIRVYGLILSIVICAKIALIDFVSIGDVRSKTIMYILVGALALAIGCIYMVLESRESKAAKLAAGAQGYVIQPQTQYAQPQAQYSQPQPEQQFAQEQPVTAASSDPQPVVNESTEGNLGNNETL